MSSASEDEGFSGSDSEQSSENEGVVEYSLTEDQEKRYRYLLGDSTLFDRFIEAKRKGESTLEVLTSHAHGHGNESQQEGSVRRHRKTADDEDELFQEDSDVVIPTNVFTESPSYVEGGIMRSYQVQGLNWLISLYEHRINGILADEMGLGKTLQSLSLLGYLKNYRQISGPHLLVVPKSTLQNWANECRRWVPSLNAFIFHGDKEKRVQLVKDYLKPLNFDVCITSYEMCLSERAALRKIQWEYLIIDEAHRIKNEASKLAIIVRELKSTSRLLITGTPLQNNLHELWALLNFLLPDIFSSSGDFDDWFKSHSGKAQEEMVSQLKRLLQPFLLRRLKADVEHSLKPKKEVNLYVGMTEMQKLWYKRILERDLDAINGNSNSRMRLQNIVMQLRKCCNHPYLFDGAEPGPPYTTGEHLVTNSGKMLVLDKLLARLKENGSRVLLFSQMSRVLDVLEDYCTFKGYKTCRIDGQTAHEDRISAIDDYNKPGSDKFIFLLTTRAGGLGINLATADIVILFDSDWNPQVDLQAQDRAHRIGQTKQVCVFRLVTEHSVEEKIIEKALQKLRLDQLVIQQGKLTNVNKPLSQDEMLSMIRHGADKILLGSDANGEGFSMDIEDLLRRGEERTKELQQKYQNVGYDDLQKFVVDSFSVTDDSNRAINNTLNSLLLQQAPGKRERKGNYHVDTYFREALRVNPPKAKSTKPPIPKDYISIHDFQFFPSKLAIFQERDVLAHQRALDYKADNEPDQHLIDEAEPLTEAEQEEKLKLGNQGFKDWLRRDYQAFLKGVEKYGRQAHEKIVIEGKSNDQVTSYAKVFWKNYKTLSDADKIQSFLDTCEAKKRRDTEMQSLLNRKLARHKKTPISVIYAGGHGKQYVEEEDRFLITNLADIGVGTDEAMMILRERILMAPEFRFNWFIKTRTAADLMRRCMKLVGFIEKELASEGVREEKKRTVSASASAQ